MINICCARINSVRSVILKRVNVSLKRKFQKENVDFHKSKIKSAVFQNPVSLLCRFLLLRTQLNADSALVGVPFSKLLGRVMGTIELYERNCIERVLIPTATFPRDDQPQITGLLYVFLRGRCPAGIFSQTIFLDMHTSPTSRTR